MNSHLSVPPSARMSTPWKVLYVLIIGCATLSLGAKRDWQFTILKFNWTSTDEKVLATPLRAMRIAPGMYGLTGTIEIGVLVDDSFMVEMKVLRSAVGNGNFLMTPYGMKKLPIEFVMNTFYRQFVMNAVQNCSDLPYFEKSLGSIGPQTYHLDKCMLQSDIMPMFVRQGFYRVVLMISSPLLEFEAEVVSQVHEII